MASIIKRKKAYSVVYNYIDEWRDQTEVGNMAYPQRGSETKGGGGEPAEQWDFPPSEQSESI